MEFDVKKACILYGYRGSLAHNMYIPPDEPMSTDDRDFTGVCIAPIDCYLGLEHFDHKEYWEGDDDIVIYDLRKFVRLLIKSNPNVLGFLWSKSFLTKTELGQRLIDNRDLFSSKYAYKSFVGYAKSQLHKMNHQSYQGYMGAKRKELVNEFGYDVKNAAHLIRLLRMGAEFLTDGQMKVWREDANELKEIKQGKWSKERVKSEASKLFTKAEEAHLNSPLPEYPDTQLINDLLVEIYKDYFNIVEKK